MVAIAHQAARNASTTRPLRVKSAGFDRSATSIWNCGRFTRRSPGTSCRKTRSLREGTAPDRHRRDGHMELADARRSCYGEGDVGATVASASVSRRGCLDDGDSTLGWILSVVSVLIRADREGR